MNYEKNTVYLEATIEECNKKLFLDMLPFLLNRVSIEVTWEYAHTPELQMMWAKHIFNTQVLPYL